MDASSGDHWAPEEGARPHHRSNVWRLAKELAVELYEITERFPKREKFGLTSQLRKAAVSVPSNIAEGKARGSDRDFLRFLYMARGSLEELDTQMEIASELAYLDGIDVERAESLFENLSRALEGLIRKIRSDLDDA